MPPGAAELQRVFPCRPGWRSCCEISCVPGIGGAAAGSLVPPRLAELLWGLSSRPGWRSCLPPARRFFEFDLVPSHRVRRSCRLRHAGFSSSASLRHPTGYGIAAHESPLLPGSVSPFRPCRDRLLLAAFVGVGLCPPHRAVWRIRSRVAGFAEFSPSRASIITKKRPPHGGPLRGVGRSESVSRVLYLAVICLERELLPRFKPLVPAHRANV